MYNQLAIILEASRIFSLPMSLMSWLVIFTFGVLNSGNIFNGVLACIGISFMHLATNVLDDYFDYKALIKQVDFDKVEYLKNSQKTKCRYIIQGLMSPNSVLYLALIYMGLAGLAGLYLYLVCGKFVIYYALIGCIFSILYPFLSRIKLSELAIAIIYGPTLFGGVYFVMTKMNSFDVFILSLPSMFVTMVLLYIHTVMDFDYDLNEGKSTIANSFNSQLDSLIILKILLILAYVSPILLCIFDIADWQIMIVYITIPMAVDLYNSLKLFATNPKSIPTHKWYYIPMENKKRLEKLDAWSFMIRMYQARNLMIYFSSVLVITLLFAVS